MKLPCVFRFKKSPTDCKAGSGFTIIEMLVASAVLAILLVILATAVSQSTRTISQASAKVESFAAARSAFDTVNQSLSQATLNTYYDYYMGNSLRTAANSSTFKPDKYGRASNLQFIIENNDTLSGSGQEIFFQAAESYSTKPTFQSTEGLLNCIGFYVTFGDNSSFRPTGLSKSRYRYRLMQYLQPTEGMQVYQEAGTNPTWVNDLKDSSKALPLADNVIAFIVWPRLPIAEDPTGTTLTSDYTYNSVPASLFVGGKMAMTTHQLPPDLLVTMIVIDEAAARRLEDGANPPSAIAGALSGRFVNVSNYANDLAAVESALNQAHVSYRVYSATVAVRESKFTIN